MATITGNPPSRAARRRAAIAFAQNDFMEPSAETLSVAESKPAEAPKSPAKEGETAAPSSPPVVLSEIKLETFLPGLLALAQGKFEGLEKTLARPDFLDPSKRLVPETGKRIDEAMDAYGVKLTGPELSAAVAVISCLVLAQAAYQDTQAAKQSNAKG